MSPPSDAPTSGSSYDADVEDVDLATDLQDVCADAIIAASHCKLKPECCTRNSARHRSSDFVGLTNQRTRHQCSQIRIFCNRSDGHIWVRLVQQDKTLLSYLYATTAWSCPLGFDLSKSRGLRNADHRGTFKTIGGCNQPSRGRRWDGVRTDGPAATCGSELNTRTRCRARSWASVGFGRPR